MKRVLLVGGSGGLGTELVPLLTADRYEVFSPLSSEFNLQNEGQIETYVSAIRPEIVIHSAVRNYDAPLHKTDYVTAAAQIDNNVTGLINLLRHVLPSMRANKYGRIIYFSSVLSKVCIRGTGIYSACKSFNETLIRTAAVENAKYGVTCNSLRLGYMDAGIIKDVPVELLEKIKRDIPLGRLGTSLEIYKAIQFLIDTEYVTGASLDLSGGLYGD